MLRILQLLLLIILVACQAEGEITGDLISGHRVVDNSFTVTVPTAGTRNAGDVLTFTLTFPYPVTVLGGTPRLTLNVGGTTRYATYVSGDGTNTLIFSNTVDILDNDSNGIAVSSTLDLNGSTLTYTGTNGPGNCSTSLSVPSTSGIKVDNIAPTVSLVTAPSNATYYLGTTLTFTVTMSEATTITGTPRLELNIGGITEYADYLSGSGTTSLKFRYTVVSGDLDTDGIAVAAAIDANGGSLRDVVAHDATLTFAAPNTSAVLVNGNSPYVTAITPPANGTYGLGDNLDFVFTFSEVVLVTGTPTLTLTIGSTGQLASYYSGSGTTQLTFRYVIQAGEVDSDGIAAAALFSLTSATIRDAAATNAINSFTMTSLTSVKVADNRPVVSSFNINNATYYIGNTFTFTALFNEAVTVTGAPTIAMALTTGGPVYATYASGSGTTNIVFAYTVSEGTDDSNGAVITSPIVLNSGSIKSSGGVDANLTFTQPSTPNLRISGIRPTITTVTPSADGTYTTGQTIDFVVTFSETIYVGTTSGIKLNLTIGGTARQASYLTNSGTNLTFQYIVAADDLDIDGLAIGTISLTGAAYINDGGSTANTANLTFTPPTTTGVLVNATTPEVSSVNSPANATYIAGQNLDFVLNYSEAVTITGTPRLSLNVGGTTAYASYSSGSGGTAITFRYTVASGHEDTDGITASTTMDNNGGTILSALSVPASTTVSSQTLTSVLVDGIIPTLDSTTQPSDAIYTISSTSLSFTVTWSSLVNVTGTPRLTLTVGSTTRYANYTSGTGTATLTFVYTINAADLDLDGLSASTLIDLNTGAINDNSGNPAPLTMSAMNLSAVRVNYANMLTWWDIDDSSTVSTSACGIAYCATQITDKNGGTVHATASGTAKPEYLSSGFGGGNNAYLQFDNVTMVMGTSAALNPVQTVFVVFQTEVAAMTDQDLFYESGPGTRVRVTSTGDLSLGTIGSYSLNGSGLAGAASTFSTGMVANTSYIVAVQYLIGSNFTTPMLGSAGFGGKIAEVLVYSSALTAAEVAAIEAYLNAKHQIY